MKKISMIVIVILLVLLSENCKTCQLPEEFDRFQAQFNMSLPKEADIIFSERDYGAMSDGHLLYVFQLTDSDMIKFLQQGAIRGWFKLPFSRGWIEDLQGPIETFYVEANRIYFYKWDT